MILTYVPNRIDRNFRKAQYIEHLRLMVQKLQRNQFERRAEQLQFEGDLAATDVRLPPVTDKADKASRPFSRVPFYSPGSA